MAKQLKCGNCGSAIAADDVNIDLAIAKCRVCQAVFNVVDQIAPAASIAARKQRPPVPMPDGIQIDQMGFGTKVVRRWFSAVTPFLLIFCLGWNGFLVFWYAIAFSTDAPLMMLLFPLIHVTVGIGMGYVALAQLFNRTTIQLEGGALQVRHGPIPWRGNQTLPITNLRQLYCTTQHHRGRHGRSWTTYDVNAVTTDNRKIRLLKRIPEQEQALFIEQKLEESLEMEDQPVPGELAR